MSTKTDELLQGILDAQGPLGNARLAKYHESCITTAAVAALVIRPTTASLLTIHNGEISGGSSLVLDRLFAFNLVTAAAQSIFSMWYCLQAPSQNVAIGANELTGIEEWGTGNGRPAQFGTVKAEVDATVIDDGWFPCGNWGEGEEVGVLPGGNMEWECNGRLVVPPGHALSLHVVAGTTGETFNVGASWWRLQV